MAADGTNSALALSLSFSFRGRNTIGLRFLYLAFVTGIKLWWSADGILFPNLHKTLIVNATLWRHNKP
jgi:hypothetical protein